MHDLTAFQRDLLYVLAGLDEPHGLAVKAELEEYYEGEVNHGRLYPNLDDLVEQGYVEKGEIDRRTNSYELTDAGEEVLARRRDWERDNLADAPQVEP
ncbi:MAG: PadR family transcriptional regulator [Halorientalis sp.]